MTSATTSSRQPFSAALLSFLLPGLGQLYNGQLNRAVWQFLAFAFCLLPLVAIAAFHVPGRWVLAAVVAALGAAFGIYLFSIGDAALGARRATRAPAPWQSSGVYAAVLLFCYCVVIAGGNRYLRAAYIEPYRIPSGSMIPNVLPGDFVFADKRLHCPLCTVTLERGDVVLFVYPNDRARVYIKRLVALAGDQVVLDGRLLSVNGRPVTSVDQQPPPVDPRLISGHDVLSESADGRRYPVIWRTGNRPTARRSWVVPDGHVFLLGDNRDSTVDSRRFGPVPLRDVIGKARQVWLSIDRKEGGIRWDRIGLPLNGAH